jgi:hypothetical protein
MPEILFAVGLSLATIITAVLLINYTYKKKKKFEEDIQKYCLTRNFTFESKPELDISFRISGNSNWRKWTLFKYYKRGSSSGNSIRYIKLECIDIQHDKLLFIGSGELHKLPDLKNLGLINSKIVRTIIGEDIMEILPQLEPAETGGSTELRKEFTILIGEDKNPLNLIDYDTEKLLLGIKKKYGFSAVIMKDKFFIKASDTSDPQEVIRIIELADKFISRLTTDY